MRGRILYVGNQVSGVNSTPSLIDRLSPRLRNMGFELITASGQSAPWLRALDMAKTLAIHMKGADRLLIDTYSTWAFHYAWVAGSWARRHSVPYYPILHGGALGSRMQRSPGLCRTYFGHSRQNILVSDFLAPVMEAHGYGYQIIPNGLDLPLFPFRRRENFRPRLLWVRAFSQIYHPLGALELVRRLKPRFPEVSLLMIGPEKDGSLRECQVKAKEWDLESQVQFLGPMTQLQWAEISQDADFFINTSLVDNMPVSLLEALALGLPLVSLNTGGIPRLIVHGKDGWLVDSLESMTEALVYLIENPSLCQSLSWAGRQKAESYGWAAIEKQWIELWEKE